MTDDDRLATRESMQARRAALLGPSYRLFYDEPVHVVRGEGTFLYDQAGNAYLDVYNNVPSVGHCHPQVVKALQEQAATLNTHTRYLHDDVLDYAERLLASLPDALGHMMFTCTGSEANDLALRIARHYTGQEGIIVTETAYHGGTLAIADISPSLGITPPRHVRRIAPPDTYRGPEDLAAFMMHEVQRAIADLQADGYGLAACFADSIFSSDGVFAGREPFLTGMVEAVHAAGGLYIADEVQPGFGRLGETFWGFERHVIVPDIVTMGKPMGAGHPIAGLAVKPECIAAFGRETRYFNTFGGNPVSAKVGMAVLDVIEAEGLQENAAKTGALMMQELCALAREHAVIGDVRGAGLFIGVELVVNRQTKEPDGAAAAKLVNALREKHILISASGPHGNVLKIRPPMCFNATHVDQFIAGLAASLSEIGSQ